MSVDIIIPVYNQFERLRFVLDGFLRQITDANYRIIIVDDGSTISPEYKINEVYNKEFMYIKLNDNKGRAYARNEGVKNARADVLIFNDADRIPDTYFVQNHLKCLENSLIINIGSPYEIYESDLFVNYERIWETVLGNNKRARLYPYAKKIDSLYDKNGYSDHPLIWLSTFTGNIALHREICVEIPFDEKMCAWGLENLEWGIRLLKKGYVFHRAYDCRNYHLAHKRAINFYEEGLTINYRYMLEKYEQDKMIKPLYLFIKKEISLSEYIGIVEKDKE